MLDLWTSLCYLSLSLGEGYGTVTGSRSLPESWLMKGGEYLSVWRGRVSAMGLRDEDAVLNRDGCPANNARLGAELLPRRYSDID